MNKDLIKKVGFRDAVNNVEQSKCPLCKKDINPVTEFKDVLSVKEFRINGLCQKCQDGIFGVEAMYCIHRGIGCKACSVKDCELRVVESN